MKLSPAREHLNWMERGVLTVLWENRIEPGQPERMRLAAKTPAAKQAAFILGHIQELRITRDPDTATQLALEAMYLYMDGHQRFGWAKKKASRTGGTTRKRQADEFWPPWEKLYDELRASGLGPTKAKEVLESEMYAAGQKRSMSAIKKRLKNR